MFSLTSLINSHVINQDFFTNQLFQERQPLIQTEDVPFRIFAYGPIKPAAFVNLAEMLVPSNVAPATRTVATRAMISAYSAAFDPSSSLKN
jgi:hypothetical protein